MALLIDEEDDWKMILYSPLMVIGYKHLVDFIILKGVLDVVFRGNGGLKWTSSKIPAERRDSVAPVTRDEDRARRG
jgi:hypothetical protein